jgi:hypothetical protein
LLPGDVIVTGKPGGVGAKRTPPLFVKAADVVEVSQIGVRRNPVVDRARRAQGKCEGAPACFLSGISGWFSLSLGAWVPKNLARRSMEVWLRRRRRRFRFSDFRFEAAAATLSGTGSASPRPDRNSWLRGP